MSGMLFFKNLTIVFSLSGATCSYRARFHIYIYRQVIGAKLVKKVLLWRVFRREFFIGKTNRHLISTNYRLVWTNCRFVFQDSDLLFRNTFGVVQNAILDVVWLESICLNLRVVVWLRDRRLKHLVKVRECVQNDVRRSRLKLQKSGGVVSYRNMFFKPREVPPQKCFGKLAVFLKLS